MTVDIKHIYRVRKEADCLYNNKEIQNAIQKMAKAITEKLSNTNPIVYSLMNGGLILTGQLLPLLDFALESSYIHATRYRDKLNGSSLDWKVCPKEDMKDRIILVVDDILDEGHTLDEIVKYCKERGAKEVFTAVLVDKQHDRKAYSGMKADFCFLEVEDRFLFGYGLDYKGYWRNVNGIFALSHKTEKEELSSY